MADWLIEKLDEMAELGYQEDPSEVQDSLHLDGRERALLEQETEGKQDQVQDSLHLDGRERALLEQEVEQDDDYGFDRDWIIEFRQSMPLMIGLIWGGASRTCEKRQGEAEMNVEDKQLCEDDWEIREPIPVKATGNPRRRQL